MRLSDLKQDLDAEIEGVWVPYPYDPNGKLEVRVARMGNPKYEDYLADLQDRYLKGVRQGESIPQNVLDKMVRKTSSLHILKGTRGWSDGTVHSDDLARTLCMDDDCKDFLAWLLRTSKDRAIYDKKRREVTAGNSDPTSESGSSPEVA